MKKRNSRQGRQGEALPTENDDVLQLSFFGVDSFSPRMPSVGTRAWICLGILLSGKRLSQPVFLDMKQGWRLSAAIYDLNKLGWPDKRRSITHEWGRRPIREYWLAPDVIAEFSSLAAKGGCDEIV